MQPRAYCLLLLCSCAPEPAPAPAPDPLGAFAYLKAGEVWIGNSPTEQHQAVTPDEAKFDRLAWTSDGGFLVATTRWSGVRFDGEAQTEAIGGGSCYASRGISGAKVEGDLLLYADQGYEQVGSNGDTTWCSNVTHIPSGESLRSGRGLGGTSDGERLFLTCTMRDDLAQASLLDLRTGEQLWQAEFESCPTLSPGGAHLAYAQDGRVVVQPTDLSQPPVRTIDRAQRLSWSPSGHALLIRDETLQLLELEYGRVLQITDESVGAGWSTSSSHFFSAEPCDPQNPASARLRVFEYDGRVEEQWSTQCQAWQDPVLSPDGSAFLTSNNSLDENLHWVDASGTRIVDVGHSPRWRPAPE